MSYFRCACPDDGDNFVDKERNVCDAATALPLTMPQVCQCQNGGVCKSDLTCDCKDNSYGRFCEGDVTRTLTFGANSPAAVVVPVFLIVIVILSAASLYIYWKRKQSMLKTMGVGGSGNGNGDSAFANAVSFRQRSANVEFEGPSFENPMAMESEMTSQQPQQPQAEQPRAEEMNDFGGKDFSNPMFEAMEGGASSSEVVEESPQPAFEPPSAVIAPSSGVTLKKPKEVNPSTVDTGKDTQCLVDEDDSEC